MQTRLPASASAAPRLTLVVVLPTPPFWFITAMTRGGRCEGLRGCVSDAGVLNRPPCPSARGTGMIFGGFLDNTSARGRRMTNHERQKKNPSAVAPEGFSSFVIP